MHPGSPFPALRLAGSPTWLHVGCFWGEPLYNADAQVPPGSSRVVILTQGRVCPQGVCGNARRHFFVTTEGRGIDISEQWTGVLCTHSGSQAAPLPGTRRGPPIIFRMKRHLLHSGSKAHHHLALLSDATSLPAPALCTPPSSSSSLPLDLVGLSLPHAFGQGSPRPGLLPPTLS